MKITAMVFLSFNCNFWPNLLSVIKVDNVDKGKSMVVEKGGILWARTVLYITICNYALCLDYRQLVIRVRICGFYHLEIHLQCTMEFKLVSKLI